MISFVSIAGSELDRGVALFHQNEELREENELLKQKILKLENKILDKTKENEESEASLKNTIIKVIYFIQGSPSSDRFRGRPDVLLRPRNTGISNTDKA